MSILEPDVRMIEGKSELQLAYLALIVAALLLPFGLLLRRAGEQPPLRGGAQVLAVTLVLAALTLIGVRGVSGWLSPMLLSVAFVAPLLVTAGSRRAALGGLAALPLLATTTWWAPDMQLQPWRAALFVPAGVLAAALPLWSRRHSGLPIRGAFVVLLLIGVTAALLTGPAASPAGLRTLWHHWGAYVSSSEALIAGAIPYRDFPVQYGFGPMVVVGVVCGDDCWPGMYAVVAGANLLYLLALGASMLALTRHATRGMAALSLLAIIASATLWLSYPPDLLGTITHPAVGGLRFLPLALLMAHIFWAESLKRPRDWIGHCLWLLGLAWSPEAGFFATAVWWPYVVLRGALTAVPAGRRAVTLGIARGTAQAFVAIGVGLFLLAAIFYLVFGAALSIDGLLTYVRNPPGLLQPNWHGPIWLLLAGAALCAARLADADSQDLRTGFVCLMSLMAVGSYYLGRSHDNNVLNLFPFLTLALAASLTGSLPASSGLLQREIFPGFAHVMLAALIAGPATFGAHSWAVAWHGGEAFDLGPTRLLQRIALATPDAPRLLDEWLVDQHEVGASFVELAAATNWLRDHGQGPPVIANSAMLPVRGVPGHVWTSMSNLATYGLLPPPVIGHFIERGAQALHRPGWLLVDQRQPGPWLGFFEVAYRVDEEQRFGSYTAYRLVPR